MAATHRSPFDREIGVRTGDGRTTTIGITGERSDAAPVVLLHGLSQQRAFWGPVIRRLRHRPVIAVDQRGHGASDATVTDDFAIARVARDLAEILDGLGVTGAHLVGHSWGAAVALRASVQDAERTRSTALIDGGLWTSPTTMSPREEVMARLRPPDLGLTADALWDRIRAGDLGATWSAETRAALEPTFIADDAGLLRTRIGVDRHLAVLSALLDYDPWPDAAAVRTPMWFAMCTPRGGLEDPLRRQTLERAARLPAVLVQQWEGAVHDVPLQWPALVAGFIDALVESAEGAR